MPLFLTTSILELVLNADYSIVYTRLFNFIQRLSYLSLLNLKNLSKVEFAAF